MGRQMKDNKCLNSVPCILDSCFVPQLKHVGQGWGHCKIINAALYAGQHGQCNPQEQCHPLVQHTGHHLYNVFFLLAKGMKQSDMDEMFGVVYSKQTMCNLVH